MAQSKDGSWSKIRNFIRVRYADFETFIHARFSDVVAFLSLLIAFVAMGYAHDSAVFGSSLEKQQHTIDTLKIIVDELHSISYTQQFTNIALQRALDSQGREISELKDLDITALNQFQIAKKSLSLVLGDKAYNDKLDSQALIVGTRRLKRAFSVDLSTFLKHPVDTAESIGQTFEDKLNGLELQVTGLVANRPLMSRRYEYPNLMSLLDFIEWTRMTLNSLGHNYREIDSSIVHNFFQINSGLQYVEKNEPASDKAFQGALQQTETHMYGEAVKLYNQLSKKK